MRLFEIHVGPHFLESKIMASIKTKDFSWRGPF
jgi:hypothetical protein